MEGHATPGPISFSSSSFCKRCRVRSASDVAMFPERFKSRCCQSPAREQSVKLKMTWTNKPQLWLC